jgi:hypothetical protein
MCTVVPTCTYSSHTGSCEEMDGSWAIVKDILGLTFNGDDKTVWLENDKRDAILTVINGWIRHGAHRNFGIPFNEFRSIISKIRHAFTTIPAGRGLMSPFNRILRLAPTLVYLHKNEDLCKALIDCRTFLRDSVGNPTKCSRLVTQWPDYIGVKDASAHGVGGIIIGERKEALPTVFRMQWPPDITASVISETNPNGTLTNSDLERGCSYCGLLWKKYALISLVRTLLSSATTPLLFIGCSGWQHETRRLQCSSFEL